MNDWTDEPVESKYQGGARAYEIQEEDGSITMIIQAHNGLRFYPLKRDNSDWYELRAYQYEQRKKGVPIDPKTIPGKEWLYRDYTGFSFNIYVNVGEPQRIVIHAYDHENRGNTPVGTFINFRWREGYPK